MVLEKMALYYEVFIDMAHKIWSEKTEQKKSNIESV